MDIYINLLPPEKKKELKNFQLTGIILRIGASAVFASLVFWIFLIFCLEVTDLQKTVLDDQVRSFEQNVSYQEAKKAQDYLKSYSTMAEKVRKEMDKQKNHYRLIFQLSQLLPEQVYLKEMTIKEEKLILRGISLDRDGVLGFKEKLEKNELITDIESPIANFVANENVEFEFSAKIKEER